MRIRGILLGAMLSLNLGVGVGMAQEPYPNRAVRIVVPTSPARLPTFSPARSGRRSRSAGDSRWPSTTVQARMKCSAMR